MKIRMISASAALLLASFAALTPVNAASCKVTMQGYLSLATGDSYSTAVRKLGCEGEEMSRSEMAGFVTVMYIWNNGFANMNAMFQNGELMSKAQFGLN